MTSSRYNLIDERALSENMAGALACFASDVRQISGIGRSTVVALGSMVVLVTTAMIALLAGFAGSWVVHSHRARLAVEESERRAVEALSAESQGRVAAEADGGARVQALEAAIVAWESGLFELKAELAALEARARSERKSFEEKLVLAKDVQGAGELDGRRWPF